MTSLNDALYSAAAIVITFVLYRMLQWQRNYCMAKESGLPVFLSPYGLKDRNKRPELTMRSVHITDTWWLILYPHVVWVLNILPRRMKTPWLSVSQTWNLWRLGHKAFEDVGANTFMLATPRGNVVWTCDPAIMHQTYTANSVAQMPADMTGVYNLYGPNIGSSEGEDWKKHRRVVTAGFNQSTNVITWNESIHQTSTLIEHWLDQGVPICSIREWTCRLALHVISTAFFHKRMGWRDYTDKHIPPPEGRQLSFEESIHIVIARLGIYFMVPRPLLRWLPSKTFKEARLAYKEWLIYMIELRDDALSRIGEIEHKPIKSLLESIVSSSTSRIEKSDRNDLPESTIIPNIFFTIFAGHETTGNTMAFMLILLAIYPECQQNLQQQLDEHFSGRSKEDWTLEQDYFALSKGYLGAIMNEAMRVYGVVPWQARRITGTEFHVYDSESQHYVLPENTLIFLGIAAMHRDPYRWQDNKTIPKEREITLHSSPALRFDPSRWLNADGLCKGEIPEFLPFGIGPRVCPGKALALIEMTASLATLFKTHSLELHVSHATTEAYSGDSQLAWECTRDDAIRMLVDDLDLHTNIRLRKDLPICIRPRRLPEHASNCI